MRKIVIKGNAYTTQTNGEVNELLYKGMTLTGAVGDAIDEHVGGADKVIEGDTRITLEPNTTYYVMGIFMWDCNEEDFKEEVLYRTRLAQGYYD